MACLITIFECDNCQRIIALKTSEDWQIFENARLDGVYSQFCPACRHQHGAQAQVLAEVRMMSELADKTNKGDSLDAEFISH